MPRTFRLFPFLCFATVAGTLGMLWAAPRRASLTAANSKSAPKRAI